jgi:hypothetical protein
MAGRMRRLLRCVWMRGFLPAVLVLLLGVFSAGAWILWVGRGPLTPASPPRAVLGRGVLLVNWGDPTMRRWIGGQGWHLGVMIDVAGKPMSGWFVSRPIWSVSRLAGASCALEIHPRHVKIPLLWAWAVFAAPPAGVMLWRRLRRKPPEFACRGCGYDLRGSAGGVCPECGGARGGGSA